MCKMGADFYFSLKTIKDRLGANAAAIMLPIGAEADFIGYIDLVSNKAYKYDGSEQQNLEEIEIPSYMTTPAWASIKAIAPSSTLKLLCTSIVKST